MENEAFEGGVVAMRVLRCCLFRRVMHRLPSAAEAFEAMCPTVPQHLVDVPYISASRRSSYARLLPLRAPRVLSAGGRSSVTSRPSEILFVGSGTSTLDGGPGFTDWFGFLDLVKLTDENWLLSAETMPRTQFLTD